MPIPDRLRPPPPTAEEMAEYTELCRRIQYASRPDELDALLERWNRRFGPPPFEQGDFLYFRGDEVITHMFVTETLLGTPPYVADLTYDELRAVIATLHSDRLSTPEENYYFGWLNRILPDSGISALIGWPGLWFGFDEPMLPFELTIDQILAYAMKQSGRTVPGAPENVPLPYPVPPRTGA